MVQLDTRIVLRNDTKANWDRVAATAELMESEIGVETDTGRFKIGKTIVDEQTHQPRLAKWSELEYANDRNSVQVKEGADVNSLDAGDFVGDMGIVKTLIHTDEETGAKTYTHTAYVWNGTAWEAMAGNYDATNVYFKDDITLAGSYTAVGNVTKSSNAATGTLDAAGKSLAQVMQSIFTKELYPATGSSINKPTISLSGDADSSGEVGDSYTLPTVKLKIDDVGAYTYGPATDIVFSSTATNKLTLAQGAVATATNKVSITANKGAGSDILSLTAIDTSTLYTDAAKSYTFNASGQYTAGAAPKTNLGNLLDTGDDTSKWTYRIPAGTATATARTIKRSGYRYMFCGGTTENTITSAVVRAFTAKKNSKPTTESAALEFIAAGGTTKVICAYPSSWTGTPYFEMFGLAWAENTNFVAKSNIYVADFRGTIEGKTLTGALNDNEKNALNGPMEYKIYAWELDAPLEAETTKFRVYFK